MLQRRFHTTAWNKTITIHGMGQTLKQDWGRTRHGSNSQQTLHPNSFLAPSCRLSFLALASPNSMCPWISTAPLPLIVNLVQPYLRWQILAAESRHGNPRHCHHQYLMQALAGFHFLWLTEGRMLGSRFDDAGERLSRSAKVWQYWSVMTGRPCLDAPKSRWRVETSSPRCLILRVWSQRRSSRLPPSCLAVCDTTRRAGLSPFPSPTSAGMQRRNLWECRWE